MATSKIQPKALPHSGCQMGRGDILRALHMAGTEHMADLAAILGYHWQPGESDSRSTSLSIPLPPELVDTYPTLPSGTNIQIWYRHSIHSLSATAEPKAEQPHQTKQATPTSAAPAPIPTQPLLTRSQALNVWDCTLKVQGPGQRLDVPKAVQQLARAAPLRCLPRLEGVSFAHQMVLLLDRSKHLRPLWQDQIQLWRYLQELLGPQGCYMVFLPTGPRGDWRRPGGQNDIIMEQLPQAAHLIVVSDFGALAPDYAQASRDWHHTLQQLQQQQQALVTLQVANQPLNMAAQQVALTPARVHPQAVSALMAAMALANLPDERRLRYLRQALNTIGITCGIAEEIKVWNHPDLQAMASGQWRLPGDKHLPRAQQLKQLPKQQKEALLAATGKWRQSLPKDTGALEQLIGYVVDLEDQPPPAQDLPASSEDLSTRPINAQHAWLSSINPILCAMAPEYQRRVKGTSEEQDLQSFWQAAQQVARRLRLPQPLGADYLPATDQQRLVIQQQHNDLQMRQTPTHLPLWQADGPWLDCSGNATILDAGDLLTGSARQLQVAGQQLHLQQLTRPPWAERLWRNQDGLFAAHGDGAVLQLVEAGPEQPKAVWQMVYNPWPWAREIGVDDEGLWAEFAINGVGQVMRWIVPGEFVMGSPQEEADRDDDERQHQVTLSQGFWLAETACTQELWQVVMGNNPSRFTDNLQNPVEQICWDDCQQFCQRANALLEGLQLRLPTEVQWEYACRAGTSTPFSFGEQITTGQANYDGNFPYTDGPKGEYRRQTVPVSEFEPNHWGLLQMHGNVWEWCQDWYGGYPSQAVIDAQGPAKGTGRVLRGGGWFSGAEFLRCARRRRNWPDFRLRNAGLRLAGGVDPQAGKASVGWCRSADRWVRSARQDCAQAPADWEPTADGHRQS